MTVTVLNSNHPQCQIDRTTIREASDIAETTLFPFGDEYPYGYRVCDFIYHLHYAARCAGIKDDATYTELKAHCVAALGWPPEIITGSDCWQDVANEIDKEECRMLNDS